MRRNKKNIFLSFFNLKLVVTIFFSILLALFMSVILGNISFFKYGNLDILPAEVEATGLIKSQDHYKIDGDNQSATLKIDLSQYNASKLFIVSQETESHQMKFSISFDDDEAKKYQMMANQRILSIPHGAKQATINIDNSEGKISSFSVRAKNYFVFNKILFIIFFLGGIVFYIGYVFLKNNHFEWFVLVTLLFFGISTAILMPPTKGFDEYQHFLKALSVADGNFFFENGDKVLVPEKINDLNEFEFRGTYSNYEEFTSYYATLSQEDYGTRVSVPISSTASSYLFIPYIFEAIGIFVGNLFSVNVLWLLWLARIGNVLAFAGCSFLAIRLLPRSKLLLVALCLQPVMLYLGASAGFDSVMLGFLYLGLSQIYNLRMNSRNMTTREFLVIAISFCFVIMAKVSYAPILLFFFLLRKENFSTNKNRILYSIVISVLLFWVALTTYSYASNIGLNQWKIDGVDTGLQLKQILGNPLEYLGILSNYFSDQILFFYENIFGFFGYLPRMSSMWNFLNLFFILFLAVFGMTSVEQRDEKNYLSIREKAITVFSLVCMFVLTATALYMSFTVVGSDTIEGYQPRYLLPLIFPGVMCLASKRIQNDFKYQNIKVLTFVWLVIILTSYMWNSLLLPFYV